MKKQPNIISDKKLKDIIKHSVSYINESAPSEENCNSELNLCYENEEVESEYSGEDYWNDTSFDSNDSDLTLQTSETRKNMMQLKNRTKKINLDVLIEKDQTVSGKYGPEPKGRVRNKKKC